jgi:hypothetical protein
LNHFFSDLGHFIADQNAGRFNLIESWRGLFLPTKKKIEGDSLSQVGSRETENEDTYGAGLWSLVRAVVVRSGF